jgi:hypothetical protein
MKASSLEMTSSIPSPAMTSHCRCDDVSTSFDKFTPNKFVPTFTIKYPKGLEEEYVPDTQHRTFSPFSAMANLLWWMMD